MQACWDAAGEVIKAWATEGHSVALPGLGTMRFGLRSKAVEKVEDVLWRKKETAKFIVQIIVSIASAILTALGATSCMGL